MIEFVSWDYEIPNWMESHNPFMFQTANQSENHVWLPGDFDGPTKMGIQLVDIKPSYCGFESTKMGQFQSTFRH